MVLTKRFVLAITGSSGAKLAQLALQFLATQTLELNLVVSSNGERVYQYEVGESVEQTLTGLKNSCFNVIKHNNDDLFASISSGSYKIDGMIILPCSVSTASKIANGLGDNLIGRAASVCLKEKVNLVLAVRESPLSPIILNNLLTLSQNGAFIMPPLPSFYDNPQNLEQLYHSIVGRMLNKLGIDNPLYKEWAK